MTAERMRRTRTVGRRKRLQVLVQLEADQAAVDPGAPPAILQRTPPGRAQELTADHHRYARSHIASSGPIADSRDVDARHEVAARRQVRDEGRPRFQGGAHVSSSSSTPSFTCASCGLTAGYEGVPHEGIDFGEDSVGDGVPYPHVSAIEAPDRTPTWAAATPISSRATRAGRSAEGAVSSCRAPAADEPHTRIASDGDTKPSRSSVHLSGRRDSSRRRDRDLVELVEQRREATLFRIEQAPLVLDGTRSLRAWLLLVSRHLLGRRRRRGSR